MQCETQIILMWAETHAGIRGNEDAAKLAKHAAQNQTSEVLCNLKNQYLT